MYATNLQGQLPYPIHQLIVAPLQLQPGNLHFQINIQLHPNLQQYVPYIGTCCIDTIQSKCQNNQLRVFLYNQMSVNAYQNNDFLSYFKSVCQYVEMMMSKNAYPNVQTAIASGADKIAELFCAQNLKTFPALAAMIDPNLYQMSQNALNLIGQFTQEFEHYERSKNIPVHNAFNQPTQQSGYYNNAGGYQNPVVQANNFQRPNGSSMFNSGGTTAVNSVPVNKSSPMWAIGSSAPAQQINSAFGNAATVFENVKVNTESQIVNNNPQFFESRTTNYLGELIELKGRPVKAKDKDVVWIPSVKYPYNIAYDAAMVDLYYCIEADGSMLPYTQPINKEIIMDRKKHFLPSIAPDIIVPIDNIPGQIGESFVKSIKTGSPIGSVIADKDVPNITTNRTEDSARKFRLGEKDNYICSLSDTEVWLQTDARLIDFIQTPGDHTGFRTCAWMITPLVSRLSSKELANKLCDCRSYSQVVNALNDAANVIQTKDEYFGDLAVVNFFNKMFTNRLNRFVKKQLGLNINITSFMEDAVDLVEYVEKTNGKKFSTPLRNFQQTLVEKLTEYATQDFEVELNDNHQQDDLKNKPFIAYYISEELFISLNLYTTELNVDLPKGECSVAVLEEHSPVLYSLGKYMTSVEEKLNVRFNRKLIKTIDGLVLEINTSFIDSRVYLVARA